MKRNRPWILSILPLAVGLLAIGLLAGCPWSPGKNTVIPPVPSKYLAQTSAANVLANLQTAYGERKIDEYRKLFTDDFSFVFNPADVTRTDDPTPATWGLADELEATDNMFRNELVDRIELTSYVLATPERADAVTWGPGTWTAKVDAANLLVATRNEGGEPLIYVVDGTREVFFFREDPTKPIDDRPTWYIFRWEDQPIGGKSTLTASSGDSE